MLCPTFSACCTFLCCENVHVWPRVAHPSSTASWFEIHFPIFLLQVISGHRKHICSEAPTCVILGGDGIGGGATLISYWWADWQRALHWSITKIFHSRKPLQKCWVRFKRSCPILWFFCISALGLSPGVSSLLHPLRRSRSDRFLIAFFKGHLGFLLPFTDSSVTAWPWNRRLYQVWSICFYAASVLVHKSCVMNGEMCLGITDWCRQKSSAASFFTHRTCCFPTPPKTYVRCSALHPLTQSCYANVLMMLDFDHRQWEAWRVQYHSPSSSSSCCLYSLCSFSNCGCGKTRWSHC